jgi:hypothetical protein
MALFGLMYLFLIISFLSGPAQTFLPQDRIALFGEVSTLISQAPFNTWYKSAQTDILPMSEYS